MEHERHMRERTLEILRQVTGDDEVMTDLDLSLFASGLIDSFGLVTLLLALEEAFGIVIAPSELDWTTWSTARSLLADVERRVTRMKPA
jgi:D-alanine--poly(phosphoribitol) ligase subunit 2